VPRGRVAASGLTLSQFSESPGELGQRTRKFLTMGYRSSSGHHRAYGMPHRPERVRQIRGIMPNRMQRTTTRHPRISRRNRRRTERQPESDHRSSRHHSNVHCNSLRREPSSRGHLAESLRHDSITDVMRPCDATGGGVGTLKPQFTGLLTTAGRCRDGCGRLRYQTTKGSWRWRGLDALHKYH
jgi:hypothetical protein